MLLICENGNLEFLEVIFLFYGEGLFEIKVSLEECRIELWRWGEGEGRKEMGEGWKERKRENKRERDRF